MRNSLKSGQQIARLFVRRLYFAVMEEPDLLAEDIRGWFNIRQVIQSRDIALMHTDWKVTARRQMFENAIEVARHQPDGTWRWLIGDPFTVGRLTAMGTKIA